MAPGASGDAALFEETEGRYDYVDVMGERISANSRLELRHMVMGGKLWHSQVGGPERT